MKLHKHLRLPSQIEMMQSIRKQLPAAPRPHFSPKGRGSYDRSRFKKDWRSE